MNLSASLFDRGITLLNSDFNETLYTYRLHKKIKLGILVAIERERETEKNSLKK